MNSGIQDCWRLKWRLIKDFNKNQSVCGVYSIEVEELEILGFLHVMEITDYLAKGKSPVGKSPVGKSPVHNRQLGNSPVEVKNASWRWKSPVGLKSPVGGWNRQMSQKRQFEDWKTPLDFKHHFTIEDICLNWCLSGIHVEAHYWIKDKASHTSFTYLA